MYYDKNPTHYKNQKTLSIFLVSLYYSQRFDGEFKNGIQDGQGTFSYPDGRKYVGEFKNGIQNGQGTNTFSNGWNGIGEWIDVEPWNIKVFDKKGNLKMKWENGKQIKL